MITIFHLKTSYGITLKVYKYNIMIIKVLRTQKHEEQWLNPIQKLSDYHHTRTLLPIGEYLSDFIKEPIDPEIENIKLYIEIQLKSEYHHYKNLEYLNLIKNYCIESLWFSNWNNYLNGVNKYPGFILNSKLVNELGRLRENLEENNDFVLINKRQWEYLSSIYGAEIEVLYDKNLVHKKSNSINVNKNLLTVGNPVKESQELVTLMDEKVMPFSDTKRFDGDTDSSLFSKIKKKTIGFENPGYFCYLNSAIQCFLSIPNIIIYFLSLNEPPNSIKQPYCHKVYDLISCISQSERESLRPFKLWKEVSKKFSPTIQHDFAEFFKFFITTLSQEIPGKINIIAQTFVGTLKSTLKCNKCKNESTKYEQFFDVSVEFTPNLKKSLKQFVKPENIEY